MFSELSPAFPADKKEMNAAKNTEGGEKEGIERKGLESQNAGYMLFY